MPVKPLSLMRKCLGLHTGIDSLRASYNPDTGVGFLSACSNVKVNRGYQLERRDGYVLQNAIIVKDVFSDGIDCLAYTDTALFRVNRDFTLTGLRSGLTTGREMFFTASPEGIFYNNGTERGRVARFGASYVWDCSPENYAPVKGKQLTGPPQGTLIHYHNGRMFIADGRVVWYSDYRSYGNFYMEEGMLQHADVVIGFASAGKTLYVLTETGVYAYVGDTMKDAVEVYTSNHACIKGTIAKCDSTNTEYATLPLWMTKQGIHIGTREGIVRNVTEDRIVLPDNVVSGKAVCFRGEYLAILSLT